MTVVDKSTWPRREHYDFFAAMSHPFYSITFPVDVTALREYTKRNHLSFYYSMVYCVTKAMEATEAFRYKCRGEDIILHDRLVPSFTDLKKGSDLFHITTLEAGEDAAACALRETEEELGIPPERVTILGELDWLTHQGGFVMYPVLGVVDPEAPVIPSPAEVAEVFYVPVDHLRTHPPEVYTYDLVPQVGADFPYEKVGFPRGYPWRGGKATVPIYPWGERAIWGLTGRIVRHLLEETP